MRHEDIFEETFTVKERPEIMRARVRWEVEECQVKAHSDLVRRDFYLKRLL